MAKKQYLFFTGVALTVYGIFMYGLKDWSVEVVIVPRNRTQHPVDTEVITDTRYRPTTTPKFIPKLLPIDEKLKLSPIKSGVNERIRRINNLQSNPVANYGAEVFHKRTTPNIVHKVAPAIPVTPSVPRVNKFKGRFMYLMRKVVL